jgi:hypothetical protein
MSTSAAREWWQQGLFEWQREALQRRQELAALRLQHKALLLAFQNPLAAVGVSDATGTSTIDLARARCAAADAIESTHAA